MRWPNDWRLRDCLGVCGGITLLQLILVLLSQSGFDIPVIRQVNGFILLTFVPGILLLRILRVHNIHVIESIVYSVGLSLAAVMFAGALTNFILPPAGIKQPLSTLPLTLSLTVLSAVLAAAAWLRDRKTVCPDSPKIKLFPALNSVLFLLLILVLVILGVRVNDLTGNNTILIICLLAIALVAGLGVYRKLITPAVYPFALFIISLCLLYQTTLMSPYPVGTDIYGEYQSYGMAASAGVWDYTLRNTINSCLSIVILAPAYANVLGISGIWAFKAVYPLLFSFLAPALYRIFRIQIGQTRSFLAAFFFMAVPTFSLEMTSLCRQQVAEVFLALLILLLVDRKVTNGPKLVMLMLFGASIAVAHYSIGFINFIYMGLLLLFIVLMKQGFFRHAWGWLTQKTGGLPDYIARPGSGSLPLWLIIVPVVFYFVFAFAWYWLVASGINLYIITQQWLTQTGSISETVGNVVTQATGSYAPPPPPAGNAASLPRADLLIRTALGLDFWDVSWQGKLFRILQYITQLFIITGCLRLLLRPRVLKFSLEYIALSVVSVLLLAACITLPYFSTVLNATRWYHILLITLAPFCILGGEAVLFLVIYGWNKLRKAQYQLNRETVNGKLLAYLALVILIPYFIFTSGIVYEVTQQQVTDRIDSPYSLALSNNRLNLTGIFNRQDGIAAAWLCGNSVAVKARVYTDANSYKMLLIPRFCSPAWNYIPFEGTLPASSYLYLTSWNTGWGKVAFSELGKPGLRQYYNIVDLPGLKTTVAESNRIYDNGGSVIYVTGLNTTE